jgi:hypothetical protein
LPGPAMNQLLNVTRLKAHWYQWFVHYRRFRNL